MSRSPRSPNHHLSAAYGPMHSLSPEPGKFTFGALAGRSRAYYMLPLAGRSTAKSFDSISTICIRTLRRSISDRLTKYLQLASLAPFPSRCTQTRRHSYRLSIPKLVGQGFHGHGQEPKSQPHSLLPNMIETALGEFANAFDI
jgi:hypothetical protein